MFVPFVIFVFFVVSSYISCLSHFRRAASPLFFQQTVAAGQVLAEGHIEFLAR